MLRMGRSVVSTDDLDCVAATCNLSQWRLQGIFLIPLTNSGGHLNVFGAGLPCHSL